MTPVDIHAKTRKHIDDILKRSKGYIPNSTTVQALRTEEFDTWPAKQGYERAGIIERRCAGVVARFMEWKRR